MTKKKTLNLPKVYEVKEDTPEKFHKYKGIPKLSYSQFTSWTDPKYFNDYVLQYIMGGPSSSNFWAEFGTFCGTVLEYRMLRDEGADKEVLDKAFEYLNEKDIAVLKEVDAKIPQNAVYEREIVIYREDLGYTLQGFVDLCFDKEKKTIVVDFKTGNKNSKDKGEKFYASEKYGQTSIYSYAIEEEGEEIGYCGVILLDRTYEGEFENPILHLSGDVVPIPTPYTKEGAEKVLNKIDKVVLEISSLKDTYDQLKQLTITI